MSYQHLYSRVPARVSLYNKRDGFDTFAHSSELDAAFIRGELSAAYAEKLNIHDPLRVRRGEIPVVYSQMPLSSGRVAHTAISYNPVDFTGERSAYFAHTLVLTEGEMASVLNNPETDCFNPAGFFTDISRFNITSQGAAPNPACPQFNYAPRALSDHRAVVLKYDPEMVKKLIYAILHAICQGGREVIFRLPVEDKQASAEALSLMNAIMSVLPYGLREKMSFVSFVSTPDAYQGFKVKCISALAPAIPADRCVFFNFADGTVSGMPSDYKKNSLLATFFYSLFEYKRIRDEFLPFVARITEKYDTCTLDVITLRELSFLFWQCSGFYVENTVVPDDEALCSLMDVYGKYRDGLIEEHKVRAYRPLAKYSTEHIAMPDGVYSRLSGLYPTECVAAKAVALDVLLKLIHLDLMRDSLFCFISRYYDGEIDSVKAVINANLCRVFYGGFLQQQILTFFDAHFRTEPVQTRDIILEKLLLSVRTPEIQRQILVFLDRHYSALNSAQKMRVCTTCLEMMPECDTLTALFVSLVNRRIGKDSEDFSTLMATKLTEILGAMLRQGDGRLLSIFVENSGFCEELAFHYILSGGVGAEMLVAILAAMPAHKRGDKLMRAYKMLGSTPARAYFDFLARFIGMPVVVAPSGLKELLRLDRMAALTLPADALTHFREVVIYPVIAYVYADVFKIEYGKDGLDELRTYAEANPVIMSFPQYRLITDYLSLLHKCGLGDTEGAFKVVAGLPDSEEIRVNVGEYLRSYAFDPEAEDEEITCTYQLVINYLCKGKFGFDRLYSKYQRHFEDIYEEEGIAGSAIAKGLNADRRAAASAMELILSCASDISGVSDNLTRVATAADSGLRHAIADFIAIYGFGAGPFLKKHTKDSCVEIEDMADELISERNASINSVGDAVDLILRRKS